MSKLKYVLILIVFVFLIAMLSIVNGANKPPTHWGYNEFCSGFWLTKTFCLGAKFGAFIDPQVGAPAPK